MIDESFSRVEPFLARLKIYCFRLAKNEWDAQDLMQEVLTKVYRSIQQAPDRTLTKSYLERIAANTWIDHCRRKQASSSGTVFDEEMHHRNASVSNEMSIRETFERFFWFQRVSLGNDLKKK